MKGRMKKWIAISLALILSMGVIAVTADAAANKNVKNLDATVYTKTIEKNAVMVKKGTTNLKIAGSQGYIRFRATAAKTYTFTFSNLTGKKAYAAYVLVQTRHAKYSSISIPQTISTKGGKTDTLWLAAKGIKYPSVNPLVKRPLASRSFKFKLKKNQNIYFYYRGGTANTRVRLTVK